MENIKGYINSIQTLGALDGPGVRFTVFLQGCNLRCGCCHNPDTWETAGGKEYTVTDLANKCERYKEYFGKEGGITVSGGEPLLQAEFVRELFLECHKRGINACLDTSGSIIDDSVMALLDVTDTVLLDIKYTTDSDYLNFVGCSIDTPLKFLDILSAKNIPTVIRQVIIPSLNDTDENIVALKKIIASHKNIIKTELLPFKKLCSVKYDKLKLDFKFKDLSEPTKNKIEELEQKLKA